MLEVLMLNHASIVIKHQVVSLLIDPWFEGSCFEDGWGLKFQNDSAYNIAAACTHLWVSHFHTDHFHVPTLKKILALNPNIIVIGNRSYNFKLDDALKSIGFKNVVSFREKKQFSIAQNFIIERWPTTGIDNMLLIKTSEGTLLNYNDCNIPLRARKIFAKKMGNIDVMFTNFNHASKLIDYPPKTHNAVMHQQLTNFKTNYEAFNPKYIIPFASYHYYKAPESEVQNNSLLSLENLLPTNNKILNAPIGSCIKFLNNFTQLSITQFTSITNNTIEITTHKNTYNTEALTKAAMVYLKKLKTGFLFFINFLPHLDIDVADINKKFRLNKKGLSILPNNANSHIRTNSESLYKWFTQQYGTDGFIVGAHFDITSSEIPLKWQILLALLIENRLDAVSILKMCFKAEGLRFLWNRKTEIISILFSRKVNTASQRN